MVDKNEYLSLCSKKIWKKNYESHYYFIKKKYNSKKRDFFYREIVNILRKNFDQNFFLTSGTLLGYIRNNDFIDWDDNIDISFYLKKNSLDKLKKLQKIFIKKKFISRITIKNNYLKLSNFKYGYKLDLYSSYKYKNFYYCNLHKIPITLCNRLKLITFKKTKIYIPNKYNEYLTFLYGDWKVPKKKNYETLKSMTTTDLRFFLSTILKKLLIIFRAI
tara:strand:- start:41 stop:694 length:654 start_codon:yes stop_codon:yes gene_type:complete